jgi:hypothetical protein
MTDAQTITLALRGRWHGRYGLAFCPSHANTRTPALRLADGEDGRLLALCSAGCGFAEVAAALRGLGLLGDGAAVAPDPAALAARRAKEAEDRARGAQRALKAWRETIPAPDTLAERYLRARAITGPMPPTLRFAPSAWHMSAKRAPAMVAAATFGGAITGIHRTWLAEPGRKADLDPAKAMLGPCKGAAVRLSDGAGPLVVAEGIETALSLRDAATTRGTRVWAALSAAGMAGLRLPDPPGELVVAPDGDAPGFDAADKLAARAHAAGWKVSLLPAPPGRDWNDVAMEGMA